MFKSSAEVAAFLLPYKQKMEQQRRETMEREARNGPDPEWEAMGMAADDVLILEGRQARQQRRKK